MKNQEALAIIDQMKKEISKSGIVAEKLVVNLKKLRPFAIEEEDPSLTKVIRLTYEHLEEKGSFNIPIPEEVVNEEEEELEETPVEEEKAPVEEMDDAAKCESLDYLLSIMINCDENELNREDLIGYRNLMMEYQEL
ncbi:hypothetical protein OAW23_05970 [Flavobacteriales bacterium]|nr:hypothetical protein [Flavobacteriales bacterium]MDC3337398.1 hypothetical protein [Flavobacteriales bacterium]